MLEHSAPRPQTALHCFVWIARQAGVDLSVERLIHDHAIGPGELSARELVRIVRASGMRGKAARLTVPELLALGPSFPVLARVKDGSTIVVVGVRRGPDGEHIGLLDPLAKVQGVIAVTPEQFAPNWTGEVVLVQPVRRITDPDQPFGLAWFVPELLRQKRFFVGVGVAAVMLHLLGLAVPLFFQLVIDKVLPHESVATLWVLGIAVTLGLAFEALFGFLRRFLLLYASNRIDVRTARRTFGRLMLLPISFFDRIPAGVLVRHMQQVQRIREFLSGRLFLTLLDAVALVVFLPVLMLYSGTLTILVLVFSALIGGCIALMLPALRRRLFRLYEAESQRQAFLTESIHGMATIKALALEPRQRSDWDDRTADTVRTQFEVGRISIGAQAIIGFLEKLLMVAVIMVGAHLVFAGTLTIGALVAFQMLANRVSNPLVQLIGLVNEYQETALAIGMLAGVMNQAPERAGGQRGYRPPIRGEIEVADVGFSYGPGLPSVLRDVSFKIPAGGFVGLVGTSGAGKTTLTRLIQGLYVPQSGVVRIDGTDIREIDIVHLRQHMGVVLQDSFMFRGTIRENIGMGRPDASIEQIVEAARLGGALEFVERLPKGFDTLLEENASNLSGGQRQRLSIARALLRQPRILLFDEATSALDPESEAIVYGNLRAIARGRTLIMISHRLASLVEADSIVVLDKGGVAGLGSHAALLKTCAPYQQLWARQTSFLR
ncbi:peptidase domain-containing ABC transporter [Rhodoplanes sp. TEM]|uniref:Peptidase domain-containing ABC transporter n=1 Tax=Rhodoplanes tepidamans TaxID=200616 RepID=A0ABT5J3X5_RHOTP|nr:MULTISPECIES: peptidase domain-containing ABC transporter [Rhodoplanes]MDC7784347.1 peptidase domain-containing ABC transporter [Rhodoplanes tepidamans]MDC7983389.1 peptidase domain-containing ABC transporter [Rhodoplanes sp. TEM]MDQ0354525.1 ATP-binding cassette subfamily B protein [Rhodoplanes tepidamans]